MLIMLDADRKMSDCAGQYRGMLLEWSITEAERRGSDTVELIDIKNAIPRVLGRLQERSKRGE